MEQRNSAWTYGPRPSIQLNLRRRSFLKRLQRGDIMTSTLNHQHLQHRCDINVTNMTMILWIWIWIIYISTSFNGSLVFFLRLLRHLGVPPGRRGRGDPVERWLRRRGRRPSRRSPPRQRKRRFSFPVPFPCFLRLL